MGFPQTSDESAHWLVPMVLWNLLVPVYLVPKAAHFEPAPLLKVWWHSYLLKAPHLPGAVRHPAGKAPFHPIPRVLHRSAQQGSKAPGCGGSRCPTWWPNHRGLGWPGRLVGKEVWEAGGRGRNATVLGLSSLCHGRCLNKCRQALSSGWGTPRGIHQSQHLNEETRDLGSLSMVCVWKQRQHKKVPSPSPPCTNICVRFTPEQMKTTAVLFNSVRFTTNKEWAFKTGKMLCALPGKCGIAGLARVTQTIKVQLEH